MWINEQVLPTLFVVRRKHGSCTDRRRGGALYGTFSEHLSFSELSHKLCVVWRVCAASNQSTRCCCVRWIGEFKPERV